MFRALASSPTQVPRNQSCSHYNAICNRTLQNTLVTKHTSERTARNRRTHELPIHRRLQPLCPKKHNVSCSGFLRNTSPMQHSCSHYNAFCSTNVSLWMYCYVMYSVMYCYVLYCDVWHIVLWCTVVWCRVSQVYLFVARKIASQLR